MRVLVCDDERHIVRFLQVSLERQGYTVTCARSGQEAIAAQEERPFDLVILDLHMPGGIDGCDVLSWIRTNEARKDTFVWLMATEEEAAVCAICREHRADHYVSKSSGFSDLFRKR